MKKGLIFLSIIGIVLCQLWTRLAFPVDAKDESKILSLLKLRWYAQYETQPLLQSQLPVALLALTLQK